MTTIPQLAFLTALVSSAAACGATDDSFTLDHPRILAVRAEPPHVMPGERARIDVLAGDDTGAVFETDPDTLVAGSGGARVEHAADGWYVTAPPASNAGSAGLVPLTVSLAIDGTRWVADKELVVGDRAANPEVAAMQVDGAAAASLDARPGARPELTAVPGERSEQLRTGERIASRSSGEVGDLADLSSELDYAWYSSVGALEHARSARATLDADAQGSGLILVVVRDGQGGVGWATLPVQIRP